jgi:hypothetical protein
VQSAMSSSAVRARFAPSELPHIWSSLPLRSNHASVLHGSPFCPSRPARALGLSFRHNPGTIVFRRRHEQAANAGDDARVYCFAAETRFLNTTAFMLNARSFGQDLLLIPTTFVPDRRFVSRQLDLCSMSRRSREVLGISGDSRALSEMHRNKEKPFSMRGRRSAG